jgi:ADP-ribose pyrophosphatase YjhB (NUDIX family)
MDKSLLNEIIRIKSLAETGLVYNQSGYDKDRYEELHAISLRLLNTISNHSIDELMVNFPLSKDYPTVKTDIRCFIYSPEKGVLLVQESADQKWSLPGGWADIGESPKEVAIKESREETGLEVVPKRLLAVFDKKMHPHPPQPFYVYKLVIYCEAVSTEINKGFDVLNCGYFPIDKLPPLSEDRILKSQIELLQQKIATDDFTTYFD